MYYRIGDFRVQPGKEKEFEGLVKQLFIDTRGIATDRLQVYLVRSTTDPAHYCIAGTWTSAEQWENIGETALRQKFNEKLKNILQRPREGELFEVVVGEP
ncbi:MAG TPA: antibiotic biosynthesis monooxygenase [Dehalococcoidia bacterium]|nr:antibiotic biosynthesis monooxygenase [Dehalococcoidia bacterium]